MRREDQWEPWVGQRYNHIFEKEAGLVTASLVWLEYQSVSYGKEGKGPRVVKCFR